MLKQKTELENLQHSSQTIYFSKGTILPKNADFLQNKADISKIRGPLKRYYKVYFLKQHMWVYLRTKFSYSNKFYIGKITPHFKTKP